MNRNRRHRHHKEPLLRRAAPVLGAASRVAAGMLLAGLMLAGAAAIARIDVGALWPVERVEIVGGPSRTGPDAVQRVLDERPRGFFALNLPAIRDDLRALPWVETVELRRRWPDTIEIRLTEPVPVARWGTDALVDRHGRIFGPVDVGEWGFLPALAGESGRQVELMHRYLDASARLADAGLGVTGVHESARRAWSIRLEEGGEVLMGRDPDLSRLDQLVALMPILRAQSPAPLARVDLRYPRGVAVAWQPPAPNAHEEARNR